MLLHGVYEMGGDMIVFGMNFMAQHFSGLDGAMDGGGLLCHFGVLWINDCGYCCICALLPSIATWRYVILGYCGGMYVIDERE